MINKHLYQPYCRQQQRGIKIRLIYFIIENKQLFIGPGTHLRFSNGGFILSFSPITINGSPESPVVFEGLDQSSGCLTVLQSEEKSSISHAIFDGMNTLNYEGWT